MRWSNYRNACPLSARATRRVKPNDVLGYILTSMILNIHPQAQEAFDQTALEIVASVKKQSITDVFPASNTEQSQPSRGVSHVFSPQEISNTEYGTQEADGSESARYFQTDLGLYGLSGEPYIVYRKLIENFQASKGVRGLISLASIHTVSFGWVKEKFLGLDVPSFSAYVLGLISSKVTEHRVVVPLAGISICAELNVGSVSISEFPPDIFDSLIELTSKNTQRTNEWRQVALDAYEQQRKLLEGRGAAIIKITAEDQLAIELAMQKIEDSLALLRLFTVASSFSERFSMLRPLGQESAKKYHVFALSDTTIHEHEGLTDARNDYLEAISKVC